MSWSDILYGPVYAAFGVSASIVIAADPAMVIIALDKTSGVEVMLQGLDTPTIRPAAVIRRRDLAALGKTPAHLVDAVLTLNGAAWRIQTCHPRPSPYGEADGEVMLLLTEA